MAVLDPKTDALRKEIYGRMSRTEKMALAIQMREDLIAMVRDSIQRQRPWLSDEEVEFLVRKRCAHLDEDYLDRWAAELGTTDQLLPDNTQ